METKVVLMIKDVGLVIGKLEEDVNEKVQLTNNQVKLQDPFIISVAAKENRQAEVQFLPMAYGGSKDNSVQIIWSSVLFYYTPDEALCKGYDNIVVNVENQKAKAKANAAGIVTDIHDFKRK